MWCPPPQPPTATEAREKLEELGTLLLSRRPPRSPALLLREVPPLLRRLKRHGVGRSRPGLARTDRIAAMQLLVVLHDQMATGEDPSVVAAALEVFCLRAVTLLGAEATDPARRGPDLWASSLRLYKLSCASAQSRSAWTRR